MQTLLSRSVPTAVGGLLIPLLSFLGIASFQDSCGAADAGSTVASPAMQAFAKGLRAFGEARGYALEHVTDRDGIAERYRGAAEHFVAAWKAGAGSTEVFTNAANSYAFAGDTGEAVLFYRRALAVDPSNGRALKALEHIRTGLPIRPPQGGSGTSVIHSLFFWHYGLAFSTRRLAFFVAFPVAFLFFAISRKRRRPFLFLGSLFLACALALLSSLLVEALGDSTRRDAVVMTEVQGRRGDGRTYSPSHSRPFPPGTEVTILQSRQPRGAASSLGASSGAKGETWSRVRLLDGRESWIPEGVTQRVIE